MSKFLKLFGIESDEVRKNCILLPLVRKEILGWFGVKELRRGKLYGSANTENFTLIHTGLGAGLLGDAVLYLKNTKCENIITFGSCGLVAQEKKLDIGSLVVPKKAFSWESFSDMLTDKKDNFREFYGDSKIIDKFLSKNKSCSKVNCATLGSISLEEDYIDFFKEKNIGVVDMECSALFSAASYTGKKAMALFYVSDIISHKPFYEKMNSQDRLNLISSLKSVPALLCKFIEDSLI